jgi:hypothetical protein
MSGGTYRAKEIGSTIMLFAVHQFIGTLGIDILAGYLLVYVFDVLRLLGKAYSMKIYSHMMTGTPYYPIQIGVALVLGCLVSRRTRHRAMLWVWIIPSAYLTYALIAIPTLVPQWIPPAYQAGVGESRFKHYFGWGCGNEHPCFDQNAVTVLFYISAAYSLGALLGRKVSPRTPRTNRRDFWGFLFAGLFFLFVAGLELFQTIQQGWRSVYISTLILPAGLGAFLILYALTLRHPLPANTQADLPGMRGPKTA